MAGIKAFQGIDALIGYLDEVGATFNQVIVIGIPSVGASFMGTVGLVDEEAIDLIHDTSAALAQGYDPKDTTGEDERG